VLSHKHSISALSRAETAGDPAAARAHAAPSFRRRLADLVPQGSPSETLQN
jgi:hypothetical protein